MIKVKKNQPNNLSRFRKKRLTGVWFCLCLVCVCGLDLNMIPVGLQIWAEGWFLQPCFLSLGTSFFSEDGWWEGKWDNLNPGPLVISAMTWKIPAVSLVPDCRILGLISVLDNLFCVWRQMGVFPQSWNGISCRLMRNQDPLHPFNCPLDLDKKTFSLPTYECHLHLPLCHWGM